VRIYFVWAGADSVPEDRVITVLKDTSWNSDVAFAELEEELKRKPPPLTTRAPTAPCRFSQAIQRRPTLLMLHPLRRRDLGETQGHETEEET
jgi:hypothetical protein